MNYDRSENNFPWNLDEDIWTISDHEWNLLCIANMLQEYKWSIRQCAQECCVSKSLLHDFISNGRLRRLSYECYVLCRKQLLWNKKHPYYFKKKYRR